jgi:hypothetical protein
MNTTTRITPVICTLASVFLFAATPASAQFSAEDAKCRATVAKAGTKLTKTVLKAFSSCHKARNADDTLIPTDCNDAASADLGEKLPGALTKFTSSVTNACPTQSPSSLLYETCPAPCATDVPALADFEDVAECLACVATAQLEVFSHAAFSEPDPTLEKQAAACHRSITTVGSKLVTSILKSVVKCQASAEKDGAISVTECTQTSYDSLVADALADATTALETKHCAALTLPNSRLDACSFPSTVAELASCVVETANTDAQFLSAALLALPDGLVSTTTTTTTIPTTTTLPPGDPDCPAFADVSIYSRDTLQACTTNGDCTAPRTCDTVAGRCSSPTETDLGWTGLAHDLDTNTGARLRLNLGCEGPAAPGCGTCTVAGVNPEPGNCRCANDPRTVCDNPLTTASECGGSACNCYLGAPTPISAGGTPFCVLPRLASNVVGSVNVDTGDSELSANLRSVVYLGTGVRQPCPTCGGTCSDNSSQVCDRDADCVAGTCTLDPIADDGVRGGTCTEGASVGLPCDVTAMNASLPAYPASDGGSGYSLDCMPSPGMNISGFGLSLTLEQGTGASALAANVPCGPLTPGEDCPCLVCSGEPTVACNAESDCSAQQGRCSFGTGNNAARCDANADCNGRDAGSCTSLFRCSGALVISCASNADCDFVNLGPCTPSTCSARGSGNYPLPNECEDLLCDDLGGGEGECTTGPDFRFCDNVVHANGRGIYLCSTNDDCLVSSIGIDGGACTMTERAACFLDPITASGTAHPDFPVTAATYCSPPTVNAGVNAVSGLPGPVRARQQTSLTSYCASDPDVVYTPGVGGCP